MKMRLNSLARLVSTLVLAAASVCAYTQQANQAWSIRYNGPANLQDSAYGMATDGSGNLYVTGQTFLGDDGDLWVAKYGPNGNLLWSDTYAGQSVDEDIGLKIAVDGLGSVYVAGNSGRSYVVIKYNSSGIRQWVQRFQDGVNGYSSIAGLAVDSAGNVHVTGTSTASTSQTTDIVTIKYNSSGVQQWLERYLSTGNANESAVDLKLDSAGNVIVVGDAYNPSTDFDIVVIKYNAAGSRLWDQRYDGPGLWDGAAAAAVDSSGNIYVGGFSMGFWVTLKYSSTAVLQWSRIEAGGSFDVSPTAIEVDSSGNVLVSGYQDLNAEPFVYDVGVIKYSSSGNKLWSYSWDSEDGFVDFACAMTVDNSGNAYIAGYSAANLAMTQSEMMLIKLAPNGSQQWIQRFSPSGTGLVFPCGVAINALGDISVAGSTMGESSFTDDVFAVRYTQEAAFTLFFDPEAVTGGSSSRGTINLASPAPAGGLTLSLSRSGTAVTVPTSVRVLAGSSSVSFNVTTASVSQDTAVNVTAAASGSTAVATLQVRRQLLGSVTVSPTSVVGGNEATGTVNLVGPAPSGGFPVTLSDNHALVEVPAGLVVPEGETSATFPVATGAVSANVNVSITGRHGSASRSATLQVRRPILRAVNIPAAVPKNAVINGTVTLNFAAPTGGLVVALASSDPSAISVPQTVTVRAGTTSIGFSLTVLDVQEDQVVTITATGGGSTREGSTTVRTELLESVTTNVPEVVGGANATGTVRLHLAAPPGGKVVALESDDPVLSVPPSVTVQAGQTAANFVIGTSGVGESSSGRITATLDAKTRTTDLIVHPASLHAVAFTGAYTIAGSAVTGTVSLNGQAPLGGLTVQLQSTDSVKLVVDETVFIPAGASSAPFAGQTFEGATGNVQIVATQGLNSRMATLNFTTVTISGLSLSATSVRGGGSVRATVTLSANAPPGGLEVVVASTSDVARPAPTVLVIRQGTRSGASTIQTSRVTTRTSVRISASLGSNNRSVSLTVNP